MDFWRVTHLRICPIVCNLHRCGVVKAWSFFSKNKAGLKCYCVSIWFIFGKISAMVCSVSACVA